MKDVNKAQYLSQATEKNQIQNSEQVLKAMIIEEGSVQLPSSEADTEYGLIPIIRPTRGDGDINEDKNVDQKDLRELGQVLQFGDMNRDGKVDAQDFQLLHEQIANQIFPQYEIMYKEQKMIAPIKPWFQPGDVNRDGKVDYNDLQQMSQAMKHGDMDGNKVINGRDYHLLRDKIGPHIMELRNGEASNIDAQAAGKHQVDIMVYRPKDGDINENGTTDSEDLSVLKNILKEGDVNKDGVVDRTDFDLINQKIIQQLFNPWNRNLQTTEGSETPEGIRRPVRIGGDVNKDGKVDYKDLQLMSQAMKHADMNNDKKLDNSDVDLLAKKIGDDGGSNLKEIERLSKLLLDQPYSNLQEIDNLARLLGKETGVPYSLGKSNSLFNFFLREKDDLNGDGNIDYKDVIDFWKQEDHPIRPLEPILN